MDNLNRLIIGTVQFGMPYGISNNLGQPSEECLFDILNELTTNGVSQFDTAPAYGSAEILLAKYVSINPNVKVLSKIDAFGDKPESEIIKSIDHTLNLFGENLTGLYFHRASDLWDKNNIGVIREITKLRKSQDIKKLGVSVYSSDQFKMANEYLDADMIQVPFNVYDQRLSNSQSIMDARKKNTEIHVRSVFLQGLLLMNESQLNKQFPQTIPMKHKLESIAKELEISVYQLCLNWVFQQNWADKIVIGLASIDQAKQVVNSFGEASGSFNVDLSALAFDDLNVIDPSRWL